MSVGDLGQGPSWTPWATDRLHLTKHFANVEELLTMHVYVSIDMEGVAGVATKDQVRPGGRGYPRAQELMTGEANAVIHGAFAAGATAVTVNDSHGPMDNLLHDQLDDRCRVIVGRPKAHGMVNGITPDVDLAMFVGYHAPAGEIGVLAHSFSSAAFARLRLNGTTASELWVNSLFAASQGVPTGLVSGDNVICDEAKRRLPNVTAVDVKSAEGFSATNSVVPEIARKSLHDGAYSAVARADSHGSPELPDELVLEAEMTSPTAAELASFVPGAKRLDALTVRREVDSVSDLIGLISVWTQLA